MSRSLGDSREIIPFTGPYRGVCLSLTTQSLGCQEQEALLCTVLSTQCGNQNQPWPTVTICSTHLLAVVEGGVLTRQERSYGSWPQSLHSKECSSPVSALTSVIRSFVSSFLFPLLASIAPVIWRISSLLSMMVQMFCITLGCPLLSSSNSPEVALWCLSLYL